MSMVWTLYEHYMNSKLNLGASEQHFLTWTNVWKHKNAYLLVFLYAVVHINICACCVRNPIILVTPPCGVFSYILIWASAWNVICDACMHTDNLLSFRLLCTDASPFFLLNSSLSFSLLSFYSASFLIFLCCLHTSFSPQSLFFFIFTVFIISTRAANSFLLKFGVKIFYFFLFLRNYYFQI